MLVCSCCKQQRVCAVNILKLKNKLLAFALPGSKVTVKAWDLPCLTNGLYTVYLQLVVVLFAATWFLSPLSM